MNEQRRIEHIVSKALDKKGPDRESYLNEVCGKDLELKEKVESMLAIHEESGVLPEPPLSDPDRTLDDPPLTEKPRTVIGQVLALFGHNLASFRTRFAT